MAKLYTLFILLSPFFACSQNDLLFLTRSGKHILSFTAGNQLDMETIYGQTFKGVITAMRNDSIFLNGRAWHYQEIAIIRRVRIRSGFLMIGTGMMAAAGGILVLGAVNGLIHNDNIGDWYTTAGLITSGILFVGGFALRRAFFVKYTIGKKYKLQYVDQHLVYPTVK